MPEDYKVVDMPSHGKDIEAYKNVTVIISERYDGETVVSWVRQPNTEKISVHEAYEGVTKI